MQLNHIRDLLIEKPLSSGHAFLSAASGLVRFDNLLCVVADDEHCLAQFALNTMKSGQLDRLIESDLPRDAAQRKKVKPDFEILLALPCAFGNRLLAIGSGSTAQRMRGAIIDLPVDGCKIAVRLIDLKSLFAAISPLVPQINLEGAVLRGGHLLLFNRGNMQFPALHILEVPLAAIIDVAPVTASLCATLSLPMMSGVPLTVTDACRLENGHFLLSTVAEATADSYADGMLMGAAIVELDAQFNLLGVEPLEPPRKVEGIAAQVEADGAHLLCVTDADDPNRPSALFEGWYRNATNTNSGSHRSQLEAEWLALTREALPALAKTRSWPVSADHCFMRILLDAVHQGRWDRIVQKRPAYKHIDTERLIAAVMLAKRVVANDADIWALNTQSLAWRGKL